MTSPQTESRLIVLTELKARIEDATDNMKKWVTVIDEEGNAEVFFKYQGTTVFSILEKEAAPENLCRSLLHMVKYPRTLTINYLDLEYREIFDEKYFPKEVMDLNWIQEYHNVEKLRQNFVEEFPEEVWPSKDFKICFLFRKNNVPAEFYEKTHVVEVCPPQEIGQKLAEREEKALAAAQAKKVEEEKKVEESKTNAAKPKIGATPAKTAAKTTTATAGAKTSATTAKTGASTVKAGASNAVKTGSTPTKTVVAAVKTTTSVSKTSSSSTKVATGNGAKPKAK